jgi:hypothetical protein
MSQHGTDRVVTVVGYLRSCIDRRFLEVTRRKFEELTKLPGTEYFHEAFAGGVLNNAFADIPRNSPPTPDGADYVYHLGDENPDIQLVVMGWQAHIDHCGGLPNKDDKQIRDRLQTLVNSGVIQQRYSKVHRHVFLLASLDDNNQPIVEIIEPT